MNIEKIRNLGPDELAHQQRDAADQLFRLKFQLKMGQTTGLKKMRELRKDLARIKTIARERELGILTTAIGNATTGVASVPAREAAAPAAAPSKPAKVAAPAKKRTKTAAGKKKAAAPKKASGKKKSKAKK